MDCNFGTPNPTTRLYDNSTMLHDDMMTCDRLVGGLCDAHIQLRLFAGQDFSFKTAHAIVLRAEGAVKQQRDLKFQAGNV